jgi:hypothetical protein
MPKFILPIALVGLGVGVLALLFFPQYQDSEKARKEPIVEFLPAKSKNDALRGAPEVPVTGASTPENLALDYSRTKNVRAFIAFAKQHPELGGYNFARQAIANCNAGAFNHYRDRGYLPSESQAAFAKRQEVTQFWYQRCQGLLDSDIDVLALIAMRKESLDKQDAPTMLSMKIEKAITEKNRDELRQALKQLFSTKAPLDLRHILYKVAIAEASKYGDMDSLKAGMWFEGKAHLDNEEQIYLKALDLLPCSFGIVCDQYDMYVAQACVAGAGCYNSRLEYIRNITMAKMFARYPEAAERTYQNLIDVQHRIVAAIERGDVDAFMRP